MKKQGFTLAEVLITVTIIGVIAVLTIPNLIKKYEHKEYEVGFQKAWALTNQVVLKANQEAGTTNLHDYGSGKAPYNDAMNLLYNLFNIDPQKTKYVDRSTWNAEILAGYYSKSSITHPRSKSYIVGQILVNLRSGLPGLGNSNITITIDTNGVKKPNRLGYDVWDFVIDQKTGKLTTYKDSLGAGGCTKKAYSGHNGMACSGFALINKNPDNSSQSYWDGLD